MKKETLKKILLTVASILGVSVIFPLTLALYILDRLALAVLVHINSLNFKEWAKSMDNVLQSIFRVVGFLAIYGLYKLIVWIL